MESPLLDQLHMKNKTMSGVIDYVNAKYIMFFDLGKNEDPAIVSIVLLWRMHYSHIRFSIFKELYFKHLDIATPVLINKKSVCLGRQYSMDKPKRRTEKVHQKIPVA